MRNAEDRLPIRWLRGVMAAMNAAGTAWIGVVTILICCDIAGRTMLNTPIFGVPEIVKVSVVAIVWLQMAHTLRIGGHIRSDVILDRLPPRARAGVNVLAAVLGTLVFALIVYGGWHNMIEGWRIGEFEGEQPVRVPTYPVRTILCVGALLTAVEFVLYGWRNLKLLLTTTAREGV